MVVQLVRLWAITAQPSQAAFGASSSASMPTLSLRSANSLADGFDGSILAASLRTKGRTSRPPRAASRRRLANIAGFYRAFGMAVVAELEFLALALLHEADALADDDRQRLDVLGDVIRQREEW